MFCRTLNGKQNRESENMVSEKDFTRINNNINGNPRYVIHYLSFLTKQEHKQHDIFKGYDLVIKRAKKWGGGKFHNKQYGGGIVFSTYSVPDLCNYLNKEMRKLNNTKTRYDGVCLSCGKTAVIVNKKDWECAECVKVVRE
jgi:hypothetical protein